MITYFILRQENFTIKSTLSL